MTDINDDQIQDDVLGLENSVREYLGWLNGHPRYKF